MQTLFRKWKVSFRMKKSQCGSCLQKKKKNDNKNKKDNTAGAIAGALRGN